MHNLIFEHSPLRTVSPCCRATHPEECKSINRWLIIKEFQSETHKNQESQSKDVKKSFPAPFYIFSAGVPPKEKEACKNLPRTDARETTQ